MNRRLFIPIWLFGMLCGGFAQTAADPNEGSRLDRNPSTGIYTLYWWGRTGSTYFIQHSEDLETWIYFPGILPGGGAIRGENFETNADRFFVRLKVFDFPTGDPFNADFDGDGISNQDEIAIGTDPLDADTDHDGVPDGTEAGSGSDPTNKDNPLVKLSVFGFSIP